MKKKIIPLLLSLAMLSSCTIFAMDVNKAPDDTPPDEITSDITSSEETSSEESSELESETNTQTSTGPIVEGLTYEEAQPIIKKIKEYINANEPLETRYSSTIETKAISGDIPSGDSFIPTNIKLNNEISDVYVDFNSYVYKSDYLSKTLEPSISLDKPKETITSDKTNYIYQKEVDSLTFINAIDDKINNSKTYTTSDANSVEEVNAKFTALTKMGKADNKNLTLVALDLISSSQITSKNIKSYNITSDDETSISCEIEFDLNIEAILKLLGKIGVIDLSKIPGIEALGPLRIKAKVIISNYRLYTFKVAVAPSSFDIALYTSSYNITYQDKEFVKPDLSQFENKNAQSDPNPDKGEPEVQA